MPSSLASSSATGVSGGQTQPSGGSAGLGLAEEDVLKLEGKDPVVQALDDLHRTKVVLLLR